MGGSQRKTISASKIDRVYELMNKRRVKGFYNYVTSDTLRSGSLTLLQTTGMGKLKPNTLMMGFKGDWQICRPESLKDYVQIIRSVTELKLSVAVTALLCAK